MKRRRFIALTGALAAGAGCIDRPGEGASGSPPAERSPVDGSGPSTSGTPTPVRDDTATGTSSGGTGTAPTTPSAVEVTEPSVQPGVVTLGSPDSITVRTDAGQYLVVHARVEGAPPDASAFEFAFDGSTYRPEEFDYPLYRDGGSYDPEDGSGWLVFGLSESGSADDARLSWPGGGWTPPETERNRLASPTPSFSVGFDAPERVGPDESPTLSITATNEGGTAGRCVLALNRVGPMVAYTPVRRFVLDLEPGETVTREHDAKSPYDAEGEPRPVRYHLHTPDGDSTSRAIEPRAETGTPEE